MTRVRAAMEDYLRILRRLGFEMPQDGRLLEGFVEFLEQADAERITTELALRWARKPADAPRHLRQRLIVARGFARHLRRSTLRARFPPLTCSQDTDQDRPMHLADSEIAALMDTALGLRPPLRAARHVTLIGLSRPGRCQSTRASDPRRSSRPSCPAPVLTR